MPRIWRDVLPPLLALLIALALWHGAVQVFAMPRYLLPSPAEVAASAAKDPARLLRATGHTAAAAVAALVISLAAGTMVGFVFSQSATIRRSLYPYAIFLQTVPIVAIAPLIVLWFGYGTVSVVVVAVVISVFPVITGATTGLTRLDPLLVDVFRLYGANRWQMLWMLRLPSAVPHIVNAAKTSSGLTVIGAIVGEFFTGYGVSNYGLGYLIRMTADQSRTADLFAAVLASTALGVLIFASVSVVAETFLSRWR
jgi:NitT/TauT family transport system permease protein